MGDYFSAEGHIMLDNETFLRKSAKKPLTTKCLKNLCA